MAAGNIVENEEIGQGVKSKEVVYEKLWVIPEWSDVQQNHFNVRKQTYEFLTGKSTGPQTKWKVGFRTTTPVTFYLYWELNEEKGFPDGRVEVSTNHCVLKPGTDVQLHTTQKEVITKGQKIQTPKEEFRLNSKRWKSESWTNSSDELTFKLKLVIVEPQIHLQTEEFNNTNFAQVLTNFASLVGDQDSADMKIMTSDGKGLFAHQAILKVQCPVFESVLHSDLTENKIGIVSVKDVNAKTMGIILHLLYTGKLLPSWRDDDTVVCFTYAVGKYQLGNVLKFLDEVLGGRVEEDAFQRDIQLLALARKLDLKTAEKELLGRIKKTMDKVNSGDEFFGLYEWEKHETDLQLKVNCLRVHPYKK